MLPIVFWGNNLSPYEEVIAERIVKNPTFKIYDAEVQAITESSSELSSYLAYNNVEEVLALIDLKCPNAIEMAKLIQEKTNLGLLIFFDTNSSQLKNLVKLRLEPLDLIEYGQSIAKNNDQVRELVDLAYRRYIKYTNYQKNQFVVLREITTGALKRIKLKDIIYAQTISDNNEHIIVYQVNKPGIACETTIGKLTLQSREFFRCSSSSLLNIRFVSDIDPNCNVHFYPSKDVVQVSSASLISRLKKKLAAFEQMENYF